MTPELWWQGDSQLAESPLWSAEAAAFFWVDISGRRLWRHDGSARPARCWALPQQIGCIALREGGGLIAALQDGVYALDLDDRDAAGLRLLAAAPHGADMRFNDGRCDRQGRFWVGSLHMAGGTAREAKGRLERLSAPGEAGPWQPALREDLLVANGLGFSPDGGTLYFSDSHASQARVWACDYDSETGRAGAPRDFITALPAGRPDGAAVDAEGGYWICANDGAAVLRYTPAGRLDRRIALPVAKPTMCAFGGPALDLLVIASMRPEEGVTTNPLDGALFALRPGVQGLPETPHPCTEIKETTP
ncbi:SMP-30/gluconolactonase/LRE family protein [Paucibacter sp. O1-1]|nr:SMP-30/gluconolactonase/LRE family protein [Paucibacter sp. O1-1]MDA3826886.1 SMP-30/gluconolactonase/LRE family protein [Paucibacter sp. O1-1]